MDSYFDSAIIIKLYVREATSADAIRLVASSDAPYGLNQWQLLEVRNAIRLKVFRNEITVAESGESLSAFAQDIANERWRRPAYSVAAVEQKAEELSASCSTRLGCRTLDIIHVAAAVVTGAREFITFDVRQAALARFAGLGVRP